MCNDILNQEVAEVKTNPCILRASNGRIKITSNKTPKEQTFHAKMADHTFVLNLAYLDDLFYEINQLIGEYSHI